MEPTRSRERQPCLCLCKQPGLLLYRSELSMVSCLALEYNCLRLMTSLEQRLMTSLDKTSLEQRLMTSLEQRLMTSLEQRLMTSLDKTSLEQRLMTSLEQRLMMGLRLG